MRSVSNALFEASLLLHTYAMTYRHQFGLREWQDSNISGWYQYTVEVMRECCWWSQRLQAGDSLPMPHPWIFDAANDARWHA